MPEKRTQIKCKLMQAEFMKKCMAQGKNNIFQRSTSSSGQRQVPTLRQVPGCYRCGNAMLPVLHQSVCIRLQRMKSLANSGLNFTDITIYLTNPEVGVYGWISSLIVSSRIQACWSSHHPMDFFLFSPRFVSSMSQGKKQ